MIDEKKLVKEICNTACKVYEFETDELLDAFMLGLNAKQICVMDLIAKQPKVRGWIPVDVVEPAEGEHVRVSYIDSITGNRRCDSIAYLYNGLWYWQYSDPEYGEPACVEITAWRPLGEPYMEEQEESDAAWQKS